MKVTIIGAGAMGGLVAGLLERGGAAVTLVDANQKVIDSIRSNGLRTTINGTTRLHNVGAELYAEGIESPQDIVVFLVKGQHTRAAYARYGAVVDKARCVMTLQNGIGHVEELQSLTGGRDILYGPVQFPGKLVGLGHAATELTEGAAIHFGCTDKKIHAVMAEFAAMISTTEVVCKAVEEVDPHVWLKLRSNVRNAIFGLLHLTSGQLRMAKGGPELLEMISLEVDAIVAAKGLKYPVAGNGAQSIPVFGPDSPLMQHLPSTAQDVKARRTTETNYLNGAVSREGQKMGVPTPINDCIYRMMQICEATYDHQFELDPVC